MTRFLVVVALVASCGDDTGTPRGSGGSGGNDGGAGMGGSGGSGGSGGTGGTSGSGGTGGMSGSGGTGGSGGAPQMCGFAACPQGFTCMDDPRDNCDPARGGTDCPGVCESCRAAPNDACGLNHVRCGTGCCNVGEWCDTVFSSMPTCKCANHAACTGGNQCESPGPVMVDGCGTICCGAPGFPCPQ